MLGHVTHHPEEIEDIMLTTRSHTTDTAVRDAADPGRADPPARGRRRRPPAVPPGDRARAREHRGRLRDRRPRRPTARPRSRSSAATSPTSPSLDVRMPGMDGIDVVAALARSRTGRPGRAAVRLRRRAARRRRARGGRGRIHHQDRRPRRDLPRHRRGARAPTRPLAERRSTALPDLGRGRLPGWTPRLTVARAPAAPARRTPAGTSPSSRSYAASTNPRCAAGSTPCSPSSVPTTSPTGSRSPDRRASSADAQGARRGRQTAAGQSHLVSCGIS